MDDVKQEASDADDKTEVDEQNEGEDTDSVPTTAKRKNYSIDFKLQVVKLVKGGKSVTYASRRYDIARKTIKGWIHQEKELNDLKLVYLLYIES